MSLAGLKVCVDGRQKHRVNVFDFKLFLMLFNIKGDCHLTLDGNMLSDYYYLIVGSGWICTVD